MGDYLIGTTLLNMVDPETILNAKGKIFTPRPDSIDYSVFKDLGSGQVRRLGLPFTAWNWGFLYVTNYDSFMTAYCPNASANVYIKTMKNDGTFGTFTAIMKRPEKEPEHKTSWVVVDIKVIFTRLVEIEVSI